MLNQAGSTELILGRLDKMKAPCVLFVSDFTDISSANYVQQVLSIAEQKGLIERLSPGIYCKSVATMR